MKDTRNEETKPENATPEVDPEEEFDRLYQERHPESRRWTLREIREERRRVR